MESEFELQQDLIHLNHAAVAPWPRCVRQAVENFAHENATQGSLHYPDWVKKEANLRRLLAQLINAPQADDIALLKSTSEALSVVAHGLSWQVGDNVVISDQEFPSNRIVWESLQDRGVEVRQVDLSSRDSPEQALILACNPNTRLLAISSVQYATGLRVDLATLGQFCREQEILFCIDAIQSIGALQFDVNVVNADFVMADGHKWMLGPEGLALFYSHQRARDQLSLHQFGWHMVEHFEDFDRKDWQVAATARRFECGSPNMLGIHALHASIELLLASGMEKVEQAVIANAEMLFTLIQSSTNLECLTDMTVGRYAGIVVFRHKHYPSEHVYRYLMQHRVLCALRGGGVRFSPHFYTPAKLLEQAISLADNCPAP
jgi:selenocysteine lyase/cysteine desulfurase